jgi:adenosylmethionine-8-amino-7-oxononanoate aminotransferase
MQWRPSSAPPERSRYLPCLGVLMSVCGEARTIRKGIPAAKSVPGTRDEATDIMTQHLLPRSFGQAFPVIVRAEGIRLWDADGHEYIDCMSGAISVVSVGHGRREVADAVHAQTMRMDYVHDMQFHNEPARALAARVTAFAGGDFSHAVFFSSGSDAVESAIKLAHDYHALEGSPQRTVVIGRKRGFHGVTMFALAAGDVAARKTAYQSYTTGPTAKVPAPYCYRCPLGQRYPDCGVACARELEQLIQELGPDNVSAFIAEPIVGAAAPALTPPAGYYEAVREICDRYGVLWIADEIATGFGRTGRNFGYQHWDAQPDILAIAKGLSGGYAALSGLIVSERVVGPFESQNGRFGHGFTFQNHAIACAAALAVLDIIEQERLVENAAKQGLYLEAQLRELAARLPIIGEIRGKGLLWGFELVPDRATKAPFDKALRVGSRVTERGLRNGLVIYQGGGSVYASDEVFISPSLIVTPADIDEIVERLALTLEEVQAQVSPDAVSEALV